MWLIVESWLDERGHSLVRWATQFPIRKWALGVADTEPCWEGRATSSGHWSRGNVTISCHTVTSFLPRCCFLPQYCFHCEMQLCTNHNELQYFCLYMDWGFNHSDAVIVLLYKPCFCWLIKVNNHTYFGVTSLQRIRNPRQQLIRKFRPTVKYILSHAVDVDRTWENLGLVSLQCVGTCGKKNFLLTKVFCNFFFFLTS